LAHSFWNKITHHQERQANEKRTKASHALFNLSSIRFHPVMDYGLTQGRWGHILISDYSLSDSCAGDTLPAWYMCGGSSMKKLFPRRTMGVDAGATLLDLCLRCAMV